MALNFPTAPSVGTTHNAANGLQYIFDGTKWTSQGTYTTGAINAKKLDNITLTTSVGPYNLTVGSAATIPHNNESLLITVTDSSGDNPVIQQPGTDYTIFTDSSQPNEPQSKIKFGSAPTAGHIMWGVLHSRLPIDTVDKLARAGGTMTGDINFVAGQTFDGRDVSVDGTKLDGIEANATADQTNAEIRAAVEAATDSNVFTDADHSKLNAIEASADVTDATNVDAAGAVMNSDASTAAMGFVVDEDNFASDSATKVPTQQSVKAYITSNLGSVTGVTGTAPIASSGGTTPASSISAATTSAAGSMSSADKTKLDGIATGATAITNIADLANVHTASPTDGQVLKWDNGNSRWAPAADQAAASLEEVVDDTTPQLGGDLDVNGKDIVSTSNGSIDLDPNGNGVVIFKGNSTRGAGQFKLNCEQNSHGITIKGPAHSAGANYTLVLPTSAGSSSQYLATDGNGILSWSAGTASDGTKLPLAGGTLTGDVLIDNQKDLRFGEADANGTNYVAFQAPASIASDVTFTLPNADGTNGQALTTNGSGTLTWSSGGADKLALAGGTLTGDLLIDNQKDLRFGEADGNGTNYIAFQAPATIASDVTWTLPAADGTANQRLTTNGSGVLSWETVSTVTIIDGGNFDNGTSLVTTSTTYDGGDFDS